MGNLNNFTPTVLDSLDRGQKSVNALRSFFKASTLGLLLSVTPAHSQNSSDQVIVEFGGKQVTFNLAEEDLGNPCKTFQKKETIDLYKQCKSKGSELIEGNLNNSIVDLAKINNELNQSRSSLQQSRSSLQQSRSSLQQSTSS
ncbi:hypothetical protein HXK64_03785, partial [Candidatus Gracilibacteria bacterium]|nr:hypothetical protein [Candidatus Gracilibacteria bacterium]